jgi:chlorite dismutase
MERQMRRQVVKYVFYKVDPAWRRLGADEKEQGRKEFQAAVERHGPRCLIRPYSLVGLRGDADFMLWVVSDTLEAQEALGADIYRTGLGKYLHIPYNYLAMTRRSIYLDKHSHPGSEGNRETVQPSNAPYLFVYPFVKTRPWYRLPKAERQKIMDGHIAVGHKYPSVKINTTYSFGIDDQEFVVAFEADDPGTFIDLVMELREGKASSYTLRDTPAFTCVARPLPEILEAVG